MATTDFMVGDIKAVHLSFPSGRPADFNEKFQRYAQNPEEGKLDSPQGKFP